MTDNNKNSGQSDDNFLIKIQEAEEKIVQMKESALLKKQKNLQEYREKLEKKLAEKLAEKIDRIKKELADETKKSKLDYAKKAQDGKNEAEAFFSKTEGLILDLIPNIKSMIPKFF